MVMRVGGLATGMDIESIVNKLMAAERIPLNKLEQDRTKLTWQRDAFRDINRAMLELDNMMLDMKMSKTYNRKSVSSTQENAVTATGTADAQNGTYLMNVTQLATNAINMSEDKVGDIREEDIGIHKFSTFTGNGNNTIEHEFEVKQDDTIDSVLKRITDADNGVRAFLDHTSGRVIIETVRTGQYNPNGINEEGSKTGPEILFDDSEGSFFKETLKLVQSNEVGGQDAVFTYNNSGELTSKGNNYHLNGINFEFHNVTEGNARLSVSNNVDGTFDSIVKFVDKYNEVIEKMNTSQQEEIFRDFKPLTDEQKEDMSEDQIKKWEEKAMSGILRGESAIKDGMYSMRSSWYANVDTGTEITSLTQIGITTSSKYMDGGKLEIDEDKLRAALQDNPEDVQKLFSNSSDGNSRGLVHRLDDAIGSTMKRIEERAGKDYHTLDNYSIGKRMKDINSRITQFEARMKQVETRNWNQFTQMEKAIQRMNDQSAQLFSQFGQG